MLLIYSQQSVPSLEYFYLVLLLCNELHFKGNCEKRQHGRAASLPGKSERGAWPARPVCAAGRLCWPTAVASRDVSTRAGGERHRGGFGQFRQPRAANRQGLGGQGCQVHGENSPGRISQLHVLRPPLPKGPSAVS